MSSNYKFLVYLIILLSPVFSIAQSNNFISVKGKEIIGTDNKPFLIRGTNLGNWLVPEGYMFKFKTTSSPRLIDQAFTELLGPEEAKVFWLKYQLSHLF